MSIIKDFDEAKTAIINPEDFIQKIEGFPKIAIATFSNRITEKVLQTYNPEVITYLYANTIPIYKLNYKGVDIAYFTSKTGAPASVNGLEALIALGSKELIYFGSCGVLNRDITTNKIVVPTHAIRDEGTSYHYLKETEEIELDPKNVKRLVEVLNNLGISYSIGKTWTTDAIFRETRKKFEQRRQQGSIVVEMECSALAAVAQFRGASFTQFLYGADNLDGDKWDNRKAEREESKDEVYLKIALEYALAINNVR